MNCSNDIKPFAALGIPGILEGEKTKMPEVLNRPIVMTRTERRISHHAEADGTHAPYIMIQFYFADDESRRMRVLFTASKNIISQIDNPRMTYPCGATVRMMGKSFCLT